MRLFQCYLNDIVTERLLSFCAIRPVRKIKKTEKIPTSGNRRKNFRFRLEKSDIESIAFKWYNYNQKIGGIKRANEPTGKTVV